MKKHILAAGVAAMISITGGTAWANPVELTGSVQLQHRNDTETNAESFTGTQFTAVINAKTEVQKNLDFYARFGLQNVSNSAFSAAKDFNENGDTSKSFVGTVDQYGFLYHNGGFEYKIGRQDITIGSTALLYNNSAKIGKYVFTDGVSVSGTSGITSLQATAVREDRATSDEKGKVYALQASYQPSENWTVGGVVARYASPTVKSNHWAVNTGYEMGKYALAAEYGQSDASASNKAYDLGLTYNLDDKNAISVTAFKVEENGSMNGNTDFDNGRQGFLYSFNHQLTDSTALNLYYQDSRNIADSSIKYSSFRTTLSYSF